MSCTFILNGTCFDEAITIATITALVALTILIDCGFGKLIYNCIKNNKKKSINKPKDNINPTINTNEDFYSALDEVETPNSSDNEVIRV